MTGTEGPARPVATDGDREKRRVLVTGAAGTIGSGFVAAVHAAYSLRLLVQPGDERAETLRSFGEVVSGDLGDLEGMKRICAGIDTVVHLAGNPDPSALWDDLLPANIVGAYHTYVAARAANCRRLIYASSIHAVSGYPPDVQVKTTEAVNPGDLYGVTKCFGEALGRYMAEQEGLSVIALRIGAYQPLEAARQEGSVEMLDAFISERDMHQLLQRCIEAEDIRFAILHAISDNRFKRLDISDARMLVGYAPQDDLTAEHPALKRLELGRRVQAHDLGDARQQSGLREDVPG